MSPNPPALLLLIVGVSARSSIVWLLTAVITLTNARAQGSSQTGTPTSVFDEPALLGDYNQLKKSLPLLLNTKKWTEAENTLNQLLDFTPWDPILHYQLTRVHTLRGDNQAALASLSRAVESGLIDASVVENDPILAALRLTTDYPKLMERAGELASHTLAPENVKPVSSDRGQALLSPTNTYFDFRNGIFRSLFAAPTIEGAARSKSPKRKDETGQWLEAQIQAGKASGNLGDFYDNRDIGHSKMDTAPFPLLTRIAYGPEAVARNLHNGPQFHFLYNQPTVGNSSTAVTGSAFWRSHPRFAYTDSRLSRILAAQYASNQLYLYPEHHDHDPEHGDLFPANTPYVLISQGSSGSDQPFLKAIFEALAALQPDVKEKLIKSGALMATIQQLFRYSNQGIQNDEAYLSAAAHPSVFDSARIDRNYLVRSANKLSLEEIPPVVRLKIVSEEIAMSGKDFFSPRGEALFSTPQAIARVFRGMNHSRKMVVSAAESLDLNEAPLTYHWVMLRGDPQQISIQPMENGSTAEITVQHQKRRPITPGSDIESARVDIGVFAHNGTHYSAPAFISYYFLDHEKRVYDDKNRILSVDYRQETDAAPYIDPLIDGLRDWHDEFHYSKDSPDELIGWTRTLPDGTKHQFAPSGVLVVDGSPEDGIETVKGVRYLLNQKDPDSVPSILMKTTDNSISYDEYLKRLEKATRAKRAP